jgi:folate-binding protein YgfZ
MASTETRRLAGYSAATNGAAYFPQPAAGYLRIGGPDRQTFLQRQTTNDVRLLTPGRALVSVLTSPAARILDVLTLVAEPGESLGALTLTGRAAETFRYLRSRIFFMDKVTLEDASAEFAQFDLLGPAAPDVLRRLGFDRPPDVNEAVAAEVAGAQARALYGEGLGFRLLFPASQAQAVTAALASAGADRLSVESFAVLRVEAGQPAGGHELVEDFTPLETGLAASISDSKGCYTGQEVIARQITYDKVTRLLVGLTLEGAVNVGDRVWSGAEDRSAGRITSTAHSPRFGHIALAVLRRPLNEPGTAVTVGEREGGVPAVVVDLPFSKGD